MSKDNLKQEGYPVTELVPVLIKRRGRQEMRFVPVCRGCGQLILDVTEANIAVVGGTGSKKTLVGLHRGSKVYRLEGKAFPFCWACDAGDRHKPWDHALYTFRDRDDASQRQPNFATLTYGKAG